MRAARHRSPREPGRRGALIQGGTEGGTVRAVLKTSPLSIRNLSTPRGIRTPDIRFRSSNAAPDDSIAYEHKRVELTGFVGHSASCRIQSNLPTPYRFQGGILGGTPWRSESAESGARTRA